MHKSNKKTDWLCIPVSIPKLTCPFIRARCMSEDICTRLNISLGNDVQLNWCLAPPLSHIGDEQKQIGVPPSKFVSVNMCNA